MSECPDPWKIWLHLPGERGLLDIGRRDPSGLGTGLGGADPFSDAENEVAFILAGLYVGGMYLTATGLIVPRAVRRRRYTKKFCKLIFS